MNRLRKKYTAVILVVAFVTGACSAAPAQSPATTPNDTSMYQLILDVSDPSTVSEERAVAVTSVVMDRALAQPWPVTVQVWLTGASLQESRLVWEQTTAPSTTGTARMRAQRRARQLDAATGAMRAIVAGALAVPPRSSPLFEVLAKVVRAKPPGVRSEIIFVTDMAAKTSGSASGGGLDMECHVPTDAEVARYLKAGGLLQPDEAFRELAAVTFAYVDVSAVNARCPGGTLAKQAQIESIWRKTLVNAGVPADAIAVLAGVPDLARRGGRGKRPRRKKSPLSRFTALIPASFLDRNGNRISLANLPTPVKLGIALHQYIISLIGSCPSYKPGEDPKLIRAVQNTLLTSEVEAQRRKVEALLEELAAYPPGWLLIAIIVLLTIAEVWATAVLLRELGVADPVTAWLWATGQVAAMVWYLETLARKAKSRLAYVAGYALVVVLVVVMAYLRAGDLGNEEGGAFDQVLQVILLSAVVCGIPFLLSAALGVYNERAPIARKLRNEKKKLKELEARQIDGETTIDDGYSAVEEWKALYEQVRAQALVQFSNYFSDSPDVGASAAVSGGKGDMENDRNS